MTDCCAELRKELQAIKAELQAMNSKFVRKEEKPSIIQDAIRGMLGHPEFLLVGATAFGANDLAQFLTKVKVPQISGQALEAQRKALEAAFRSGDAINRLNDLGGKVAKNSSAIGDLLSKFNGLFARVNQLFQSFSQLLSRLQPLFALLGVVGLLLSLAQLAGTLTVIFPRLDAIDRRLNSFETGLSQSLGLIQQAFSRATRALDAANLADRKAVEAQRIANDAKDIASNANRYAEQANSKATTALFESGNAQAKADRANSTAENAINNAQIAINKAQIANNNANAANNRANQATERANRAFSVAEQARLYAQNLANEFRIFSRRITESIGQLKGEIFSTGLKIRQEVDQKIRPVDTQTKQNTREILSTNDRLVVTDNKATNTQSEVQQLRQQSQEYARWPQLRSLLGNQQNSTNQQLQQTKQTQQTQQQQLEQAKQQITQINQKVTTVVNEGSPVDQETKQQIHQLTEKQNQMLLLIVTLSTTIAAFRNKNTFDLNQIKQNTTFNNLVNASATGTCQTTQNGGCTSKLVNDAANRVNENVNNRLGNLLDGSAQAAQLAYLMRIDNKLGPQVPGGISGFLGRMQRFTEKAWEVTRMDRVVSWLTLFTSLHNALMLSNNLAVTLGGVVDNGLNLFGVKIKDETGEQISFNALLGNTVKGAIQSIIGRENYTALTTAYKQANRIYQAGANIIFTVQGLIYSVKTVVEYSAENLGRIGNGLKKERVVGPQTWPWMSENVTANTITSKRINDVMNGLNTTTEGLSALEMATGSAVSARDSINELRTQKTEFETLIRESEVKPLANNRGQLETFESSRSASRNESLTFPDVERDPWEPIEP